MRRLMMIGLTLVLALASRSAFAQAENKSASSPMHYFHLSYSVQEVSESGKVTNSRNYVTSIATDGNFASIRTGDKFPVRTDDKQSAIQYIDVGINIDSARAQEVDGKLALKVSAEVSSNSPAGDAGVAPIIRQNSMTAMVLLTLGKPTIIFSSDNLRDKGRIQVELTATRAE